MKENILNIAVIGCSNMARLHMQGIVEAEGAELYAICDTAKEMLDLRLGEFTPKRVCEDYRELVEDEAVDAVVIVTPDKLHLEMTCAFLEAGKAVLCEKPMALTLEECEEMMRVERATGGKLMIGQICRCTPGFMMAKEIIGEDKFIEVYVSTPLEECERRDIKGLYKKAREGKVTAFTGISSPYEVPENYHISVDTSNITIEEAADEVMKQLEKLL